jgi:hypothetical protein
MRASTKDVKSNLGLFASVLQTPLVNPLFEYGPPCSPRDILPSIPAPDEPPTRGPVRVPSPMTREKLAHLHKYIDQYVLLFILCPVACCGHQSLTLSLSGMRLPTVSAKTAYRDIWQHTTKHKATLTTLSSLSAQIVSHARDAPVCSISMRCSLSRLTAVFLGILRNYLALGGEAPAYEYRGSNNCWDVAGLCPDCHWSRWISGRLWERSEQARRRDQEECRNLERKTGEVFSFVGSSSNDNFTFLLWRSCLRRSNELFQSIQDVHGIFDMLTTRLKNIHNKLNDAGRDNLNPGSAIHQAAIGWETLLLCGVALLT